MNSILGEGTKEHWVRRPKEQGGPCGWSRKRRGRCEVGLRGDGARWGRALTEGPSLSVRREAAGVLSREMT